MQQLPVKERNVEDQVLSIIGGVDQQSGFNSRPFSGADPGIEKGGGGGGGHTEVGNLGASGGMLPQEKFEV